MRGPVRARRRETGEAASELVWLCVKKRSSSINQQTRALQFRSPVPTHPQLSVCIYGLQSAVQYFQELVILLLNELIHLF